MNTDNQFLKRRYVHRRRMRHNTNTNLTANCASNSRLNHNDGIIAARTLNTLLDIAVFLHTLSLLNIPLLLDNDFRL